MDIFFQSIISDFVKVMLQVVFHSILPANLNAYWTLLNKIWNFFYLPWLHLHWKPSKVSIHFWVTGSQVWWLFRHSFSGGHFIKFHEVWRTCPADLNLCSVMKFPGKNILIETMYFFSARVKLFPFLSEVVA